MNEDILKKIEEQDKKLDDIYRSVEKMRKYFLWTLILSLIVFILPLIILVFILPQFINTLNLNYLGL